DIEIDEVMIERERAPDRLERLERERHQVDVLVIKRVLEGLGGDCDSADADDQEHEVGDVDLADPLADAARAGPEAIALEPPTEGERRGIAGNEDEYLGRVREAEILERQVGENVARDVIDEDEDQRQAAKEIEARIARAAPSGRRERSV